MKNMVAFLVVFLFPVAVQAMTPLTDSELSDVSGQAGVSIMPNITMNIHFDVIAWGDSDGLGSNSIWGLETTGGYVGITNLAITNLAIRPRSDAYTGLWPITINVASGVIHAADEAYIRLDLDALANPLTLWKPR